MPEFTIRRHDEDGYETGASLKIRTPFAIEGDPTDLVWLARHILERANLDLRERGFTYTAVYCQTDAKFEAICREQEVRRQEWILGQADEIHRKRAEAGE